MLSTVVLEGIAVNLIFKLPYSQQSLIRKHIWYRFRDLSKKKY